MSGKKFDIETCLFINNEFVESKSGKKFKLVNPATEEPLCEVSEANEDDVDIAVGHAEKAFLSWSELPAFERARPMLKLADLVREHVEELGYLEAISMGRPAAQYSLDCGMSAGYLQYYAGLVHSVHGETMMSGGKGTFSYTLRQPYGVCAAIIPWNVPLLMFCWKIAPAIAAGNCIIVKSSEKAPLTSLKMAHLIKEAGFPPGVIQVLSGYGLPCGQALATHMRIRKIAFTGSTRTGRQIQMASAQSNLKNVTLELGGKSPAIIFEDADLQAAAGATMFSIQFNSGQICMANSRIYVHESIAKEFTETFKNMFGASKLGDTLDPSVNHGPQADKIQWDNVNRYIEEGKKEGGQVILGGEKYTGKGYFVHPTIFTQIPESAKIAKEEIFGPVVIINTFKTEAEALEKANNSDFGLYASVFTKDIERAQRFAKRLQSGSVGINTTSPNIGGPELPFGGYKSSGVGRESGLAGLYNYLETKSVTMSFADSV